MATVAKSTFANDPIVLPRGKRRNDGVDRNLRPHPSARDAGDLGPDAIREDMACRGPGQGRSDKCPWETLDGAMPHRHGRPVRIERRFNDTTSLKPTVRQIAPAFVCLCVSDQGKQAGGCFLANSNAHRGGEGVYRRNFAVIPHVLRISDPA